MNSLHLAIVRDNYIFKKRTKQEINDFIPGGIQIYLLTFHYYFVQFKNLHFLKLLILKSSLSFSLR